MALGAEEARRHQWCGRLALSRGDFLGCNLDAGVQVYVLDKAVLDLLR